MLVGFTDGDGCFSIDHQPRNNKYNFVFKIGQSVYNQQLLHYIKARLGVGSITKDGLYGVQFRIRDAEVLKNVIVPIFDEYPLHTSKQYKYVLWREALFDHSKRALNHSLLPVIPTDYRSTHSSVPTKSWIIGFTEAKGSFYLTIKHNSINPPRIIHGFGYTQKLDKHVLEQLRQKFGIAAKIL